MNLPIAKVGLSVVPGDKVPTAQLGGILGQPISPNEVATPEQAHNLVNDLNKLKNPFTFSWDEWTPDAKSGQHIVWAGDARILRLQPHDQSIGQLLAAKAQGDGHWDV